MCIHTHTHTHLHAHTHTHTNMCTCTHKCIQKHTQVHTLHTHTHTHTHTSRHTLTHVHTYTHKNLHVHTHTHTHTGQQSVVRQFLWGNRLPTCVMLGRPQRKETTQTTRTRTSLRRRYFRTASPKWSCIVVTITSTEANCTHTHTHTHGMDTHTHEHTHMHARTHTYTHRERYIIHLQSMFKIYKKKGCTGGGVGWGGNAQSTMTGYILVKGINQLPTTSTKWVMTTSSWKNCSFFDDSNNNNGAFSAPSLEQF